ncbi:MAG: HAD family phosphatase [Eubacterium sp.]|nr:HAD family phosphatase [Eubacterium sp.]
MKIFFSDMDFTLLTTDKNISPKTYAALREFVDAGNSFVMSTGRALSSALKLRDRLGLNFPHSYMSIFNGAMIYDNDAEKPILEIHVPMEVVRDLIAIADEEGIHIQTYQGRYFVVRKYSPEVEYYMNGTVMPVIINPNIMEELQNEPCKMLMINLENRKRLEEVQHRLERRFGDELDFVFSHDYYLDIFPKTAGKGNAVRHLCRMLDVPIENTLAAGDEENDITMLQAAGLGIAMKNAVDNVKAVADVIADDDNDHDGLVPFLKP